MSTNIDDFCVENVQLYRDDFIRALDEHNDKTHFAKMNVDSLYSLGLTMYSYNFSFESLVYNAFATSKLDEKISLHPEQRKVLKLIEDNRGLIFSAPTSFGKTFVIFEYICRVQPKNVVLVVPTLALVDEYRQKIIKTYYESFKDYDIHLTIDGEKNYDFTRNNIFIVTHDRVIDEKTVAVFDSIDFLVIDEVYKLQTDITNERVLILNIAYYNMVQISKKYVLLAPFINGVENLDKLDDVPMFYSSNFSPVVNEVKTYEIIDEDDRIINTDNILSKIPKEDSTLIYFPTVIGIDYFIENTNTICDTVAIEENQMLNEFVLWGKKEIHPQWSIIKALEKGFLVHHGQLPLGIRMLELALFNDKQSSFTRLICTSTLLEGVNTTARNIIITKPYRNYDKEFDAFDFYNLVGRTGRLYQHCLGIAHYIKMPNDPEYDKSQALKSIEFELTDDSVDMNIIFGDYSDSPEFKLVLNRLGISYEEYKTRIARKHRFTTVQVLIDMYDKYKKDLIDALSDLHINPNQSKLNLIRVLKKIVDKKRRNFMVDTFIINKLTYKKRQSVKNVVDSVLKSYSKGNINDIINRTIRLKSSYIEFEFYSRVDLLCYFMKCDGVPLELINTLYERLLKNIEMLYYMNSSSKKMLKDMGIYEGDIEAIISVIGSDFASVGDLKKLLSLNSHKLKGISIISKYIVSRLID